MKKTIAQQCHESAAAVDGRASECSIIGAGRGEYVLEFDRYQDGAIALLSTEDYRGRDWSGIILVGLFNEVGECLVSRRYSSLSKALDAVHRRAAAVAS